MKRNLEMKGIVKLKKEKESKRFGVMFPKDIDLTCFIDSELRMYVSHPSDERIKMLVSPFEVFDFVQIAE